MRVFGGGDGISWVQDLPSGLWGLAASEQEIV